MTALFQHGRNGMIWIRDGHGGHYGEKPEQFASDLCCAAPMLPEGVTERVYEQGEQHILMCGERVIAFGPMPWPEGDEAIAALPQLITKQKKRQDERLAAARKTYQEDRERYYREKGKEIQS